MKLQCDVEVVNRMLPTFGLKNKGKSSRAVLSIGKHADRSGRSGGLYLLICTAKDRSGSKYKARLPHGSGLSPSLHVLNLCLFSLQLKDNIEKFFTWFVEEGKATVRLKEPAIDICLSKVKTSFHFCWRKS